MKLSILGVLLVLPHGLAYGGGPTKGGPAKGVAQAPPATGKVVSKSSPRVYRVNANLGTPRILDNNGRIAVIQARIRARLPQLRTCYRVEVSKNLALKGTVNMRFIIAPHGGVQWAKSTGLSKKVARCVDGVLRKTGFLRAGNGKVRVVYPIEFSPPIGPPDLKLGPAKATPGLDAAVVLRVVRQRTERLRSCYETAVNQNSARNIKGTVNTQFMIKSNGKVLNPKARGLYPALWECIRGTLASLQFPRPRGGRMMLVKVPLHFTPGKPVKPTAGASVVGARSPKKP